MKLLLVRLSFTPGFSQVAIASKIGNRLNGFQPHCAFSVTRLKPGVNEK